MLPAVRNLRQHTRTRSIRRSREKTDVNRTGRHCGLCKHRRKVRRSFAISDHLAWDENEGTYLELLQDKFNAYVRFIESGEPLRKFSQVEGKFVVIDLVSKFDLSDRAELLIGRASKAIRNAGFRLQHRVHGWN